MNLKVIRFCIFVQVWTSTFYIKVLSIQRTGSYWFCSSPQAWPVTWSLWGYSTLGWCPLAAAAASQSTQRWPWCPAPRGEWRGTLLQHLTNHKSQLLLFCVCHSEPIKGGEKKKKKEQDQVKPSTHEPHKLGSQQQSFLNMKWIFGFNCLEHPYPTGTPCLEPTGWLQCRQRSC